MSHSEGGRRIMRLQLIDVNCIENVSKAFSIAEELLPLARAKHLARRQRIESAVAEDMDESEQDLQRIFASALNLFDQTGGTQHDDDQLSA